MHRLAGVAIAGVVCFLAVQAIRPGIPARPATAEIHAPAEVKRVLRQDCYSCHSDERRLSWFDEIVPAYWLVRHDVLTARQHLNFSTLGAKPEAAQRSTLFEAVNMMQLGAMPLPQFVRLHPEAKVTPADLAVLKAYLAPWGKLPPAAVAGAAQTSTPVDLASIPPEFNGLAFDPAFESWKLLSTTDRGDNNTFRFILGNEIAFRAVQSGSIAPWPDGARMAKIAWQQELGADGLVHPGRFVQVELMVKDARRYKDVEGWGWGRWRGLDLKPYGKDAAFVNECTTCHRPVKGNDYVYTLPLTKAALPGKEVVNNRAAALPASLYQSLGWGAVTMYVDPKTHTTATLFGNEAAMRAANPRAEGGAPAYPAGAVLALVTWAQREDPHWFGGRIPDAPLSVELVQVAASGQADRYQRYAGTGLNEMTPSAAEAAPRIAFVRGLAPARLP